MDILQAISGRQSIRAYLDTAVDKKIIHEILDTARWTPSGVNIQPWQVIVVQGKTRQTMGDRIIAARENGQKENPDYDYYPEKWVEPWRSRRLQCGLAMYKVLEISREETEKRKQAWYRNYHFFGAPVGLLFFLDKNLGSGSLLDMGLFLQSIMLAARHYGLATCPQAALAEYPDIVRDTLQLSSEQHLIGGMALGYADMSQPINQYRLPRREVEEFTRWYD
ncbi:Nitroreductase [hydrothermal vent metagenome]|uniref:Nitroreductase n=1 Tax=hydrothermal vent metagenome TaxID=652676 RepID=A0A3B1BRT8_9ZZZZ